MVQNNAPILVGVDGSESSVDALRYAKGLATAMHAPLRVFMAWENPVLGLYFPHHPYDWDPKAGAEKVLDTAIAEAFGDDRPAGLIHELVEGPAAKALTDESRNSRMLVLATRGAGGFGRLVLGSVSATCAQHAHCPVLLVRPTANERHEGRPEPTESFNASASS